MKIDAYNVYYYLNTKHLCKIETVPEKIQENLTDSFKTMLHREQTTGAGWYP